METSFTSLTQDITTFLTEVVDFTITNQVHGREILFLVYMV